MQSISSSNQLKIPVTDMNSQPLRIFLFIVIDRVHKQKALFIYFLLQVCVANHNHIINNPNLDPADDILLFRNNIVNPPNLKEQNLPRRNRALISFVSLVLLCYSWNKRFKIFQKVIDHYTFSSNILKQSIKSFHYINIIILYKSIWHGLQVNATAVIEEIVEKTRFYRFFHSIWQHELLWKCPRLTNP